MRRYSSLHVRLLGKYEYDRALPPSRPSSEALAVLALPTSAFLAQHDLDVLAPLFVHALGLRGCGTLSTVPALYALLLVTPRRLSLATPGPSHVPVFTHGFGKLWEELVRVHGLTHSLRLGATVTHVTRADKDGGVAVRGSHAGTSFHDRFDYLVMGAPLMGCGAYMDLDDQEQRLFGAMQVGAAISISCECLPTSGSTNVCDMCVLPLRCAGQHSAVPADQGPAPGPGLDLGPVTGRSIGPRRLCVRGPGPPYPARP